MATHDNEDVSSMPSLIEHIVLASTWDQLYTVLRDQPTHVLSDTLDWLITVCEIFRQEQNEEMIAFCQQTLYLLRHCCKDGVELAMEEFEMPLVSTQVDPQAIFEPYSRFIDAYMLWRMGSIGRYRTSSTGRSVYALIEHEQHIFLTDTMDFYLQYSQQRIDNALSHRSDQDKDSSMNQWRILFRRARQIGIDRAWREYIQTTQGKDWTWVKLFEVFDEWREEAGHGKEELLNKPHWKSAIYEGYRKGCHFLEAHPELLIRTSSKLLSPQKLLILRST